MYLQTLKFFSRHWPTCRFLSLKTRPCLLYAKWRREIAKFLLVRQLILSLKGRKMLDECTPAAQGALLCTYTLYYLVTRYYLSLRSIIVVLVRGLNYVNRWRRRRGTCCRDTPRHLTITQSIKYITFNLKTKGFILFRYISIYIM